MDKLRGGLAGVQGVGGGGESFPDDSGKRQAGMCSKGAKEFQLSVGSVL